MDNLCSKCLCRPACEVWCEHSNNLARMIDESNRAIMAMINPDKVSELSTYHEIALDYEECPYFYDVSLLNKEEKNV